MARIKEVQAVYTGGNIWLFYGALTDGTYFLVDDNGAVRITTDPWDDLDTSLYEEWQQDHLIRDIEDESERVAFCKAMLRKLKKEDKNKQGGFCEFYHYMKWFELPI